MADGFKSLGFLMGGGDNALAANAYEEGRLHTARTEQALASARKSQLEATTLQAQEDEISRMEDAAAESGDELGLMVASAVRAGGGNAQQIMQARLGGQEYGNRAKLADPNTPAAEQFAAGQGIQGKMLSPFEMVGTGDYTNLRTPGDDLQHTPLGETMAAENIASERASNALADRRIDERLHPERYMTGGASGGVKPPSGYMLNSEFDDAQPEGPNNKRLVPISGGPADPNTQRPLGVRERQVIARVVNAGLNTAADLSNIMRLPTGVSTGILGTGLAATPGTSVLEATAGMLKYALTDDETRDYQRILAGLTNQMQTMESMGMAGTESTREAYASLSLRPLDTVEDKLMSLALIRQTAENGLQSVMAVNPLPDVTRDEVLKMLKTLAEAVPFTPGDIIDLKMGGRGAETLGSIAEMRRKEAAASGTPFAGDPGAAAAAAPGAPAQPSIEQLVLEAGGATQNPQTGVISRDDGWTLEHDAQGNYAWVSPDRAQYEEVAQ